MNVERRVVSDSEIKNLSQLCEKDFLDPGSLSIDAPFRGLGRERKLYSLKADVINAGMRLVTASKEGDVLAGSLLQSLESWGKHNPSVQEALKEKQPGVNEYFNSRIPETLYFYAEEAVTDPKGALNVVFLNSAGKTDICVEKMDVLIGVLSYAQHSFGHYRVIGG